MVWGLLLFSNKFAHTFEINDIFRALLKKKPEHKASRLSVGSSPYMGARAETPLGGHLARRHYDVQTSATFHHIFLLVTQLSRHVLYPVCHLTPLA